MARPDGQFTELIKNSPIAMAVFTAADGRVIFINRKFTDLFGYTIGDIPDLPHWARLAFPEDQYRKEMYSLWMTRVARAFESKSEIEPFEVSMACKDGGKRRIQCCFSSFGEKTLVIMVDVTGRMLVENAMEESVARLNEAQRIGQIGSWELDIVNNILVWSDEIYRMFEIDQAEFGASYEAFLDAIHPEDREAVDHAYSNSLKTRTPYSIEHRLLFPDGRVKYVRESCETFYDELGMAIRSVGTVQDITERWQTEMELASINRALRMLSDINQTLIRVTDEKGLLDEVCRIAVEVGGYRMAWVAFADQDKARTLRPVAHAGIESLYIESAGLTWADNERGRGPVGTAIRTGKPCLARNIHADPAFAPWRVEALQQGYQASIALPLISEVRPFGVLSIYSAEPDAFDDRETEILGELASDLAYGITVLRSRAKRQQVEEALKKSEEEYRTLIQKIQAAVVVHGADSKILTSNSLAQELLGLTEEQLLGKTGIDPDWHFFREDGYVMPREEYPVNQVIASRQALRNFICGVHRPGNENDVWVLVNADPVFVKEDELIQVIVTFIDITERLRDERELRESERKFSAAFQATPNLMAITSISDGRILEVNEGYSRLLGYSHDESIGKTTTELSIWADPANREALVAGLEEFGQVSDFETTLRRKDGAILTVIDFARTIEFQGEPCLLSVAYDITERKRANEELSRISYQNEMVLNSAGEGIFGLDLEGRVTFANPSAANMLGYEVEEILGCRHHDTFHHHRADGTEYPSEECPIHSAVKKGEVLRETDEIFWRKDGTSFPVQCVATPILEADQAVGAVVVFSDISERKQAVEALHKSEERFRRLAENAQDVIYRMSLPDGKYEYVSPAALFVFGHSPQEFYEDSGLFNKAIHPDWKEYFKVQWANLVKGEMPPTYEYQIIHESGDVRWLNQRNILVRDNLGNPIAIEGIVTDITEHKRVEEELRRISYKNEMVLNSAGEGIFGLDMEGKVTFVNPSASDLLGYKAEEILGRRSHETFHHHKVDGTEYPPEECPIYTAVTTGEAFRGDSEIFWRKDGTYFPVGCVTTPMREDGQVVGAVVVFLDISESKRAAEERQARLRLFESIDQVSRAIEGTSDLEQMLSDVLDSVLAIFDCDRAWLFYPCDPDAPSFRVPMEVAKPEFPGAGILREEVPMLPDMAQNLREALESANPVMYGAGSEKPVNKVSAEQFGVKSQMMIALYPKTGIPWVFGVHQCSYARVWTQEEQRLFQEISGRLTDGLTSMLAHRDLMESENRYRRIVDTAYEGIMMLGEDLLITFVNARMAGMLGYQVEEMIGQPATAFMFEEDLSNHLGKMDERREGLSEIFERRFRHKNGLAVWTLASAVPTYDADQNFKETFGMFTDITERRQAEQSLQVSEAGFREAQHLAKIGSWDWDAIDDTIYWSDEYYRIYGFEIGSPPIGYLEHLKAYTPESVERLDAVVKKAMEDGTPYELDLELARPTSTTRWISARGEAKRDADGKIVGLRGTAQNITDRKHSEEAVRQSEAEYRTLFEDSKDTVIMTSPAGEILDINAAGVELLGYGSREELLQVNIAKRVYSHPEDRKKMLENLKRQGFLKNYDLEFQSKDGKRLYLSASLTSMLDTAGEIKAIRGILHDMTEHRRLEEQLRQSQKLESIGMLAGGVAHDFNNYLTAIEGYTDLAMLELSEDSTAYKELKEARHSSDRAANLARQLLLFSRREPMHPKPVSLNAVITDLLKMLGRLIGEQYRLITHLEEGLWTINADASHIEQVIMNLVVNARDAMPGGGEITISTGNLPVDAEYASTHPGSKQGEFVHMQIEDAGCGMDAETISHIFEPFFTTKAAAYGTGLGLSVVYGIVTQHGGWINVESTPGQGTNFNISLPAMPFQTGSVESVNIPIEQLQGRGERILLVEDEGVVRKLAEKMLTRNGYSVTVASDAEEAKAIFDDPQGDFDLVFSDVILPKENGVTLVGHLLEDKPELKVLLASGYSDISGKETIQDKGYPFLQKPYQLQALLKQLRELLDQPRLPA
ncbi:MAG: PAS domain S-box protein [Actinobacteria bacterium]|nr:PAS domain S-box protein [Actinomycetota bacterium]